MKKFSVITVCLNMESEIEDTILSVLNQTCIDFEYIIKDGASKDNTLAIANSHAAAFEKRGIPFQIQSCPDHGVYDAMNLAVQEVQGQWVIFMNAGDRFSNAEVLEHVVKSGYLETADVVYGDTIMRRKNQYCYHKAMPLEEMRIDLPFCHQSAFAKRELLLQKPFSLQYKVASDYYFFLQWYREGKKFAYLPEAISIYEVMGISSNAILNSEERYHMLQNLKPRDEEAIKRLKSKMDKKYREKFWHQHLWKYVPEKLRMKRRERMWKKSGWKTEEEFFGTKKDNP